MFGWSLAACLLVAVVPGARSQGPLQTPLHLGATKAIYDEFGHKLQGNAENPGDLVQVLWASNDVINPPHYDGTPDEENPPVEGGQTAIGKMTPRDFSQPGYFSLSIADPRPGNGAKIFVRVFNAKTLADASFYADSPVYTVDGNSVIEVDVGATTNPIDPRDFDSDGLHNSWEKSLGSDQNDPDTDKDGMKDGDEFAAGTDLLDSGDYMHITYVLSVAGQDLLLTWDSEPGTNYIVQVSTNGLSETNVVFEDLTGVITATGEWMTVTITGALGYGRADFRVRVDR